MHNNIVDMDSLNNYDLPRDTVVRIVAQELRLRRKEYAKLITDLIEVGMSTSLDYYQAKNTVDSINTLLTNIYKDVPIGPQEHMVLNHD